MIEKLNYTENKRGSSMVPQSPRITTESLVCGWLRAVEENSAGAAESFYIFIHLNKSREAIKTDLWDTPQIKTVVLKVDRMVREKRLFDPALAASIKEAIDLFRPTK